MKYLKAESRLALAYIQYDLGQVEECLSVCREISSLLIEQNHHSTLFDYYTLQVDCLISQESNSEAIRAYLEKSISIAKTLNNPLFKSRLSKISSRIQALKH